MWRITTLVVAALVVSLVSLDFFSNVAPYVWICLSWLIVCVYTAKYSKNTFTKAAAVNLAAVLLVLGSFEGYLYGTSSEKWEKSRDEVRNQEGEIARRAEKHRILGWAPIKGQVVAWKRYHEDRVVFDVVYTIDKNGLRVSHAEPGRNKQECVLFFGGSYTFGAGVNDDQTMPYLVGSRVSKGFRIYNFGYSGYGAHHMLASLDHGMVDDTIDCHPKYVVYQGIVDHVRRSANKVRWSKGGPKYELGRDGKLVYRGQFNDEHNILVSKMKAQMRKSYISRMLTSRTTKDDITLLVTIIDASRRHVERHYAGSEFHVLFWDGNEHWWIPTEIMAQLKEKEIRAHPISEILPDYRYKSSRYAFSEADAHPNPLAHRILADYVITEIIGENGK
ncbi:MAG: SGNH/GDSL hydrolase family protein [Deltaproteobacteria bacterium]|nr:SGNH/GDSL hydrolase family protein [Deltaproteobacteria bacterium]